MSNQIAHLMQMEEDEARNIFNQQRRPKPMAQNKSMLNYEKKGTDTNVEINSIDLRKPKTNEM